MHPDDSKTTLSKWPFILGDALLVTSALAIAVLGDWQLTNWQVASCVLAVALGAGLFVLPYIVEFRVRVEEEAQDREAELRIFERQIRHISESLEELDRRLGASTSDDAEGVEFAEAEAVDALRRELEALAEKHAQTFALLQGQQKAVEDLGTATVDPPAAVDSAELKAIQAKLAELESRQPDESRLRMIEEKLAALSVRPSTAAGGPVVEADAPASAEPVQPPPEKPQREKPPALERPRREPRVRHRPDEPRLLKRAIDDKPDSSSSAVTRIIGSKSAEQSAPDAPEEASEEMLFAEDPAPKPLPKKRVKKVDTVLTASIFIGIGNKPYVRGSGAGLSWEQGQEMEFQEIGKWRWVAPAEMEAPVELQIYRNDTDADQSGKHRLEPGEKLEVSPVF